MTDEIAAWPETPDDLIRLQQHLASLKPEPWTIDGGMHRLAGCWICNPKGQAGPGVPGDPCWAAAALVVDGGLREVATAKGTCPAAYLPGLLALREGPLLEKAIRKLTGTPDILLVNATGFDHPRRAGLAIHLGAVLSLPTIGVTRQPLLADGPSPVDERGAFALLQIEGETVACRLRTRKGALPLILHPGWRTNLETAIAAAMEATKSWRTPEPLRQARRAAREARAGTGG